MLEGKWIDFSGCEAPIARKGFQAKEPQSAVIQICGLGFFELYLNGKKVSDDLLTPVWSDYEPRRDRRMLYPIQDEFTHRVYYREYEVTDYITEGENHLAVLLGNGWYNQHERNVEGDFAYGKPKLCFSLTLNYQDGAVQKIQSDEEIVWSPSKIVYNNIYFGETQDFRVDDSLKRRAGLCEAPNAKMERQNCPADKVMERLSPVLLFEDDERKVYDAGRNLTGWVCFLQKGNQGERTLIRYAEELQDDFRLDFASTGGEGQIQKDEYISDGQMHLCHPHFTWHGFRYFEIIGPAQQVMVEIVHSDVSPTSSFFSSSEELNWLYQSYIRTQLSNMHCGVPSDCPHRERLGYTGDGQLTCDAAMTLIAQSRGVYEKWMQDIADCQDKTTGHIQHTAPFYGGGGGPGGWGCAIVMVPYQHYRHFGDKKQLEKYYPNMLRWISYMESRSENQIVVREEEGGWCLGDWCTPEPVQISEAFVNTYFLVKALDCVIEIATCLGRSTKELREKRETIKYALHQTFYDVKSNAYCGGVQGANAFALDIGLGNAQMLRQMAEHYERLGELDTGIFGTDVVLRTLFAGGYTDTAFRLLTSKKKNSFGYQRAHGATTLWEEWDGSNSHNHPMFGACSVLLFRYILGIRDEGKLVIRPQIPSGLDFARGSLKTKYGYVRVEFQKQEGKTSFSIYTQSPAQLIAGEKTYTLLPGQKNSIVSGQSEKAE